MTDTITQPKRRAGRPSKRQIINNREQIIRTAKSDALATHQEIADKVGVCRQTVSEVLAKYSINQVELEDYKTNQADIILGLQQRITKHITDDEIKKAPFRDKIVAAGILFDKHRLQTGQSTVNMASIISIATKAEASQHADSNENA